LTISAETLINFIETLISFMKTLTIFKKTLSILAETQSPRRFPAGVVCPSEFRFIPSAMRADWAYLFSSRGAVPNRRAQAAAVRMIDGIM
jgi:hypothetical protein